MVSEIQVEDEEGRDQLLLQGFLTTETSLEKIGVVFIACTSFLQSYLRIKLKLILVLLQILVFLSSKQQTAH